MPNLFLLHQLKKLSMVSVDVEYSCFVSWLALANTDQTLSEAFSQYDEVIELKVGLSGDQIQP